MKKKAVKIGLGLLEPQRGENILEIGFGTGNAIVEIAQCVGNSGKVQGFDISTGMLHVAQKKVDKWGLSKTVELKAGDTICLPYHSEVFDAIFMSFTQELFDTPEIPVVLNECYRVLKGSGQICVVAMSKKKGGLLVSTYEWVHGTFPKYVDCRPIFLTEVLSASGFDIFYGKIVKMWGFPIEVSLARIRVS